MNCKSWCLLWQVNIRYSPSETSFNNFCKRKHCKKTSISVFKSGRCQMVQRNLEERTWYKIQIQAMNLLGESKPCVAFFVTRSQPSDWMRYEGEMFTRAPDLSLATRIPVCAHRFFVGVVVAMYAAVMLYLAFWSYERISDRIHLTEHAQMIAAGGQHCRCVQDEATVVPSAVSETAHEGESVSKWFGNWRTYLGFSCFNWNSEFTFWKNANVVLEWSVFDVSIDTLEAE